MSTQDTLYQQLVDLGYTGTLNDMQYQWLIDQGYTGTLQDMLKAEAISSGFIGQNMNLMMLGSTATPPGVQMVGYTAVPETTTGDAALTVDLTSDITYVSGFTEILEDDLVVAVTCVGGGNGWAQVPSITSSGYTVLGAVTSSDTYSTNQKSWYKFMGASPDASVVVQSNTSHASTGCHLYVFVLRDVNQSTPTTGSLTNSVANTTSITPTSKGSTGVGSLCLYVCNADAFSISHTGVTDWENASAVAITQPGGIDLHSRFGFGYTADGSASSPGLFNSGGSSQGSACAHHIEFVIA